MKHRLMTTLAAMVAGAGIAAANPTGVTDDSIKVGTVADMSGPLATWGVPYVNGMRMRLDEANEAGGVHGRKFELVIEDAQYQVPLGVRAAQKLVKREKIFASMITLGTPVMLAVRPIFDKAGVPNLFPATAAHSLVNPIDPNLFLYLPTYRNHAIVQSKVVADMGAKKVCLQSVASDYGQEVVGGVELGAEKYGLEIVFHGTHKTSETDFAGTATAIKNADCDALLLGTTIKDTIILYGTLRQLGFDKPVVGNVVSYAPIVAQANDGVTEGLMAVSGVIGAETNMDDPWISDFAKRYKDTFGEELSVQSQTGYVSADLFVKGLENAGRDLTVEALSKGLEAIKEYEDPFGGPNVSFGPDKRAGIDTLSLFRSKDQGWELVETGIEF